MAFIVSQECYCCMYPREDGWHCEHCWDEHHNGRKDNDWMDLDEWIKSGNAQRHIETRKAYRKIIGDGVQELLGDYNEDVER